MIKIIFNFFLILTLISCTKKLKDYEIKNAQIHRASNDPYFEIDSPILFHEGDMIRDEFGNFDYTNQNLSWAEIPLLKKSELSTKGAWGWTQLPLPEKLPAVRPVLLLRRIFSYFEIYANNKKIYSFGKMDNPLEMGFHVKPFHLVPLLPEYSGQTLYVRHWSNVGLIGYYKPPVITSERRFFTKMIATELPQSIAYMTAFVLAFLLLQTFPTFQVQLYEKA